MTNFHLKVQRIEQVCLFELTWGTAQRLSAKIPYPESLTFLYQEWQRTYLSFYKTSLRGRVENSGTLQTPTLDWHAKLVQAEAKFLSEFHSWLRSSELYEIRSAITQVSLLSANSQSANINLFLTCDALELARLPWESWEICTELAFSFGKINIVRSPINIHKSVAKQNHTRHGKSRVLVILGDDTGLNFEAEKKAIQKLKRIVEIKFVGWQPGKNIDELKAELKEAITSELGWDILLFAGHSNETTLTGGEISIAPNTTLSISEIIPLLNQALEKGLQFALFNSCNGLSIANTLIDLGLSQVAIMREPVHNKVASDFLLHFLQILAQYKDVQEALTSACQHLKLEDNLTYPSAYLIPSLFLHPEANLFHFNPSFIENLRKLSPSRLETIALSALFIITTQLPIQNNLLAQRLRVQAIYRQLTGQTQAKETPPVLLVQIDEKSLRDATKDSKLSNARQMDRKYFARIIDKLRAKGARVIGIDYLLDRYQGENDRVLAKSLQSGVNSSQSTWFVLAETNAGTGERLKVLPEIASPNWTLRGEIEVIPGYMQLLSLADKYKSPLYFSNLLAISYQLQKLEPQTAITTNKKQQGVITVADTQALQPPQPQLNSKTNFSQQIEQFLKENNLKHITSFTSPRIHLQPITKFSYYFSQMWLHPIVDFSVPPNQVYRTIPAWQLLENSNKNPAISNLENQIVIIAPGGYGEAGMSKDGEDNFNLPPAIELWRRLENPENSNEVLTGGEIHAYKVHHLLNNRMVVPIPDLWMILIAILLGKTLYFIIQINPHIKLQILLVSGALTVVYGVVSLQIYLSSIAVILPWFLPSLTIWLYVMPAFLRKKVDE
ncbi:CHASE2 domain-containing protein [Scytonema hofmannii FACHB-248]|uniref:CHASE2 domain-containing protein n=1 Tax=Scytonema hofmannii FACHB-248 TaxID=1842502 RepID=A0ABR8GNU2_9CYAN|nr:MULTISPECIES: CHASE2 domain-containing protein [Nostocales]MBD2604810.1 CHASE2 domain-containing protein [Scytonema hofmannii FACHB-248]